MKITVRLFLFSVLWMCALSHCTENADKENSVEIGSNEEPFRSMRLPIKRANAIVQHAEGNVINGNRAILIRIVDSADAEYFLAVTVRGDPPEFKAVFRNLPFDWSPDPGPFGGIRIPDGIQIPQDLFYGDKPFERIWNMDGAISDLIHILEQFKDTNDGTTRIAYECLRKYHDKEWDQSTHFNILR